MKFWNVKVFNIDLNDYQHFGVSSDSSDSFRDIKRILIEVHSEYKDIKIRKCKKPKSW